MTEQGTQQESRPTTVLSELRPPVADPSRPDFDRKWLSSPHDGYVKALVDVREALLAFIDRRDSGKAPTTDAGWGYSAAMDDVRRWAGGDDE